MTNNPPKSPLPYPNWTPNTWKSTPFTAPYKYDDPKALKAATDRLAELPPLVTSGEIEKLKTQIAQAQQGNRFILQGGDCAETLQECRPEHIANKLKILLQMSLVLIHGLSLPVTRIGRFAGQYAKPRSSPTETANCNGKSCTLPSYFGDLVNRAPFTPQDRQPDPNLIVEGYKHASMTLNFIRSLLDGGFADLHHPEYWDLSFFHNANLDATRKAQYQKMSQTLADGLAFMENLGEKQIHESTRVDFYTSHEGLNLHYEQAQTRTVPRKTGYFDLTAHLPWIGERNRNLEGPHIEFFKGIQNPVGIKVGPTMNPAELETLINTLNPSNEPGKIVLIVRMGADKVAENLPPLLDHIKQSGKLVLWMTDPMHANGTTTNSGIKTRNFNDILTELEHTVTAHQSAGTILGGVHFELTGEDVTECLGGAAGITESDLTKNYVSLCDPRLNYQQSLELAFLLATAMKS